MTAQLIDGKAFAAELRERVDGTGRVLCTGGSVGRTETLGDRIPLRVRRVGRASALVKAPAHCPGRCRP